MRKKKKKKIKVRQFWPKNPSTQIHKDEKNEYNRSKDQLGWEKELEDALYEEVEEEFDEFD